MAKGTAYYDEMLALKRQCTQMGVRYLRNVWSIPELKRIIEDPYEHKLITWQRRHGVESFDFRGKGIVPKKGAWIRWVPKSKYDRPAVRGIGKFYEMLDDESCHVTYTLYDPIGGYKDKKIRVSIFQIVDYSEEK